MGPVRSSLSGAERAERVPDLSGGHSARPRGSLHFVQVLEVMRVRYCCGLERVTPLQPNAVLMLLLSLGGVRFVLSTWHSH